MTFFRKIQRKVVSSSNPNGKRYLEGFEGVTMESIFNENVFKFLPSRKRVLNSISVVCTVFGAQVDKIWKRKVVFRKKEVENIYPTLFPKIRILIFGRLNLSKSEMKIISNGINSEMIEGIEFQEKIKGTVVISILEHLKENCVTFPSCKSIILNGTFPKDKLSKKVIKMQANMPKFSSLFPNLTTMKYPKAVTTGNMVGKLIAELNRQSPKLNEIITTFPMVPKTLDCGKIRKLSIHTIDVSRESNKTIWSKFPNLEHVSCSDFRNMSNEPGGGYILPVPINIDLSSNEKLRKIEIIGSTYFYATICGLKVNESSPIEEIKLLNFTPHSILESILKELKTKKFLLPRSTLKKLDVSMYTSPSGVDDISKYVIFMLLDCSCLRWNLGLGLRLGKNRNHLDFQKFSYFPNEKRMRVVSRWVEKSKYKLEFMFLKDERIVKILDVLEVYQTGINFNNDGGIIIPSDDDDCLYKEKEGFSSDEYENMFSRYSK